VGAPIAYSDSRFYRPTMNALRNSIPWERRTDARRECFMAYAPSTYTYGTGRGVRTYHSTEVTEYVHQVMTLINAENHSSYNACFLNYYEGQRNALGWHADDSPEFDPEHPIAVVSFGAPRYIYFRPKGAKGHATDKVLLEDCSVLIMAAGMQEDWEHKIPRHTEPCDARISMTLRKLIS